MIFIITLIVIYNGYTTTCRLTSRIQLVRLNKIIINIASYNL